MSQMIPFSASNLPAHLQAAASKQEGSAFSAGIVTGGFPVLSIKGKVFAVIENKERKMIMKPEEDDEPATALEVVFVAANPNRSRVFYKTGFEDGSADKPTCYSDDGNTPAIDAREKQCKTCAACPNSVKGSGQNGKGTACSLSRKTVVVAAGHLDKPMMLRVPNASTYGLADYDRSLRGVPMHGVVTKIKFDAEEATPKLQYKGVAFLDAAQFAQVDRLAKSDEVQQMLGLKPIPHVDADEADEFVASAPAHLIAQKEEAPKPAKQPKAEPKAEPAEETPKPAKQAKAEPKAEDVDLMSELDDLLGTNDD